MTALFPNDRPTLLPSIIDGKVERELGEGAHKFVVLVGVRGYRLNSMGRIGKNDRGIYDDALFIKSPHLFSSFAANTDPTSFRKGKGTGSKKGMAVLNKGLWNYKPGMHRGKYKAFRQAGEVTVTRDGNPPYEDTGYFGINIHSGGWETTSSAGCQTVPPDQWTAFRTTLEFELKNNKQKVFKYLLFDQS